MTDQDTLTYAEPPPSARASPAGAVVIGGDYRALGLVRSLGRRSVPVWVLTDDHRIAATSRYSLRSMTWPETDESRQIGFLHELAEKHSLHGWAIFPSGDQVAGLLARHHQELSERYRLTTPPWEKMRWTHDKRETYRTAALLSVDHPHTWHPADREEVGCLDCPFPAILKPAIKDGYNAFFHAKAWRVGSREELLARYDEACAMVAPELIMVQELIPGDGEDQLSYGALCVDGNTVASVAARRLRQHPVDFGRSSSYVETIDDPKAEQLAQHLLGAMRFTGLVEVEFKRDPRDRRYKLLDVNPRIWGWHSLGERAGVDFPYLLWQLLEGKEVPKLRGRPGVRWLRMVTDLPAVMDGMRLGRLSLLEYLRSLQGPLEFAIFARDDPLPALAELPLLVQLALKRGAV